MVSANRVAAINLPIDDTDPIRKFSIDPGSHTALQNPAELSPKGKPIQNFSIDPTSSIRTRLRTPFLRTPFPRLLLQKLRANFGGKRMNWNRTPTLPTTVQVSCHSCRQGIIQRNYPPGGLSGKSIRTIPLLVPKEFGQQYSSLEEFQIIFKNPSVKISESHLQMSGLQELTSIILAETFTKSQSGWSQKFTSGKVLCKEFLVS